MLGWLKEFLFNLLGAFFGWLLDFITSIVKTLVGYVVDIFLWFWEWIFWFFDSILRFLWGLAEPLIIACLESAARHMPRGLIDTVVAGYGWFQYINEWVPVQYCITLFLAYYAIAFVLYVARVIISLIPEEFIKCSTLNPLEAP